MFDFYFEEFLMMLESYNLSIWPLQLIAFIFAILALIMAFLKLRYANTVILAILAFFWLWNGIVFCLLFWTDIYNYAYIFGALSIIQGILFLIAIFRKDISIRYTSGLYPIIGLFFIAYAVIGYQFVGYFIGHAYPRFFPVGLVPCPTTIFTFGILLMANRRFPNFYILIPFIVAMAGIIAALNGVYEDIGLVLAGIIGSIMILMKHRKKKVSTQA